MVVKEVDQAEARRVVCSRSEADCMDADDFTILEDFAGYNILTPVPVCPFPSSLPSHGFEGCTLHWNEHFTVSDTTLRSSIVSAGVAV